MSNKRVKVDSEISRNASTIIADLSEALKLSQYGHRGHATVLDQTRLINHIVQTLGIFVPSSELEDLRQHLIDTKQYVPRSSETKWQYMPSRQFMNVCDYLDTRTIMRRVACVCKNWSYMADTQPWQSCFVQGMKFSSYFQRQFQFPEVWKAKLTQMTRLMIDPPLYSVPKNYMLYSAETMLSKLTHLSAPLTLVGHIKPFPKITHLDDFEERHIDELNYERQLFPNAVDVKLRVWMCKSWLIDHWSRRKYIAQDKGEIIDENEEKEWPFQCDLANPDFYRRYFHRWATPELKQFQISVRYDLESSEKDVDMAKYATALVQMLNKLFGPKLTKLQIIVDIRPEQLPPYARKSEAQKRFVKLDKEFWKVVRDSTSLEDLSLYGFTFPYHHLGFLKHISTLHRIVLTRCYFTDKLILKKEQAEDLKAEFKDRGYGDKHEIYTKLQPREPFPTLPHLKHLVLFDCFEKLPALEKKSRAKLVTIHPYYFFLLLESSWKTLIENDKEPRLEIAASENVRMQWTHDCMNLIWKWKARTANDFPYPRIKIPKDWDYHEYMPRTLGNNSKWHFIYKSEGFIASLVSWMKDC